MKKSVFFTILMMAALVFPLLGFSGETGESLVLEDFSTKGENGLPKGWLPQHENPPPSEAFQILKTGDLFYLHANGKPNRIFKKMQWNANEYPFITLKWRMLNVPDDPEKERSAYFYVALGTDPLGIPKITKYAWSSIKAVGTETSGGFFRPTTIVLQSGSPENSEWVTQTINVLEDFKRLHDDLPPDASYGIGIMTTIEAEFAEIIAHK